MELIRLSRVSYAYPGHPPVFQDLNFKLSSGQRIGILGPNGAGKSTMFQIAMGLIQPREGRVFALGRAASRDSGFKELRRQVGYLFQDPDDQLFCPSVVEDVAFGPRNMGLSKQESLARVAKALAQVGLEGFEKRATYRLSGGEKKLVALAAVLAMEPKALLLDEPFSGLDEEHSQLLEGFLKNSGLSWALVSHDRGLVNRVCDQVLTLREGCLTPLT